tara:strand:+ start:7882 stop:8145 length:264 start_codon:yes stop_codon:yes gene_type:complete
MYTFMNYWKEILIISLILWAIIKGNYSHCDTCYNKIKEIDMIVNNEVETEIENISFGEAFSKSLSENGYGSLFIWEGKEYIVIFEHE